jgi:hypothetical protein
MKVSGKWLAMASISLLAAGCATVPPSGPSVVVLPPQGKDLTQFQREDATCRQYAATRIAPPNTPGSSTNQLQQAYDIAYAQCMATSGNTVSPYPIGIQAVYAYPDPWYYDPWWGSSFGVGFVGAFGPRFHHHHGFEHRSGFAHGHSGGGGHRS